MTRKDFQLQAVGEEDRKGALRLCATTAAWIITMSTLYTGHVLGTRMPPGASVSAAVAGMSFLATVGFFQGWTGARSGLTTAMQASRIFGPYGGKAFGLLIGVTLGIGWFGWQLSFFGETVAAYWQDLFLTRPRVAMTWGAGLMIASVTIGYRALSGLSLIAVPLIVALSVWGMQVAITEGGGWLKIMNLPPREDPMDFVSAVGLVVGNGIIGAVVFPDLTRFARHRAVGGLAASAGYFLGGMFLIMTGALVTYAADVPDGDLPAAMRSLGFGAFGFLILLFAQWTTNNNNLYSGTLAFGVAAGKGHAILVSAMGLLGLLIALLGIQDFFVPMLLFLGTLIPPLAGVMIADAWLVHRPQSGREDNPGVPHIAQSIAALAAAVLGGILATCIDAGVPAVIGLATAGTIYTLLARTIARSTE